MNIEFTSKEIAEAIAERIKEVTGERCEAFSNATGSVITLHDTMIARITPLFSIMNVVPLDGPFRREITEIPLEAKTVNELREIAHAIDEAISHVLSAAADAAKH